MNRNFENFAHISTMTFSNQGVYETTRGDLMFCKGIVCLAKKKTTTFALRISQDLDKHKVQGTIIRPDNTGLAS